MLFQIIVSIYLLFYKVAYGFTPKITSINAYKGAPNTKSTPTLHLSKSTKHTNSKNPSKKDYQQYGKINPSKCKLNQEEIIELIKERKKARKAQDFQTADDILLRLNTNFVYLDDMQRLWRADGNVFNLKDCQMIEYKKSPFSKSISKEDEEYIVQKLQERSIAKFARDFNKADDLLDELKYMKSVVVDDSKHTWKVIDNANISSGNAYSYGGKRLNNISEDEVLKIEELIKVRSIAKIKKDYNVADQILYKLEIDFGVRVDDTKKLWFFLPKFDNVNEDRERRRRDVKNKKRKKKHDPRLSVPDWSIVKDIDGNDIPDGISIDIDQVKEPQHLEQKEELSQCTIPVLKEKLKAAGLPVSGKKAELIDRLINS